MTKVGRRDKTNCVVFVCGGMCFRVRRHCYCCLLGASLIRGRSFVKQNADRRRALKGLAILDNVNFVYSLFFPLNLLIPFHITRKHTNKG